MLQPWQARVVHRLMKRRRALLNPPERPSMKSTIPLILTPQSSQIFGHGYDPLTQTMALEFNSNHERLTYHYNGITPEKYAQLAGAESVGSAFYKMKAELTDFTRIEKTPEPEADGG